MSLNTLEFNEQLLTYYRNVSVRDGAIQKALREETATMTGGSMQISPEQGQFMAFLIELTGVKNILEIGTFTGYSALVMAKALPADGKLITCDKSEESVAVAKRYWQQAEVTEKIESRLGPALETLAELPEQHFDLCFIDADKRNYEAYYERCLQLTRPGGLILIDNTLWHGRVADTTDMEKSTVAIRALNEKIHGDARVSMSMLPIGDGLTLVRLL